MSKTPDTDSIVKNFNHLDSSPALSNGKAKSVMTMEAVVDVKPQSLTTFKTFEAMVMNIPGNLPAEAQLVLQALFSCFEKQKNLSEGLVGDLMWGFGQAGIPSELTLNGLKQLKTHGFIKFKLPDGSFIDPEGMHFEKAFVHYMPKLKDCVFTSES
jgi:hypothetical protein